MLDPLSAKAAPQSTLESCRACRAPDPYLFLPLGDHAPAQMLVNPAQVNEPQPAYPLNGQVCLECGLVQIADQIPAEFFRHYLYVPSGAATMHTHFASFAEVLARRAGSEGLIVDIGSNDGLLLAGCNALGARTMGFDPAANVVELAAARGVETYVDYFHPVSAAAFREKHGEAKVIVATNTFNHIGDLDAFMTGVALLLAEDGTFVMEVPHVKSFVLNAEFDNIYHEHVSEFSLLSIAKLVDFFDMEVTDVTSLPGIHSGSLRVFVTRRSTGLSPAPIVAQIIAEEAAAGLLRRETYERMVEQVSANGAKLIALLDGLKAQGKKIAGYGASARGNTVITYLGIDADYLDFMVDKNPLKHGMLSPNTRIPIQPVETIESERPDVLFMLAWNFFDEIRAQQAAFEARGGQFLVPFPEPHMVP